MLDAIVNAVCVNAVLFIAVWLVATFKKKVSLIDVIWGPSFGLTVLVCLSNAPTLSTSQLVISTLVLTWAVRLGFHLLPRAFSPTEDRRYTAMRAGRSSTFFVWWSLVSIFGLQLTLSTLFSLPFVYALFGASTLGVNSVFLIGAVIAVFGLWYESVADWQLGEFLANKTADQSVCDQGLWRFSRHPNYFGESVFWWGIWLGSVPLGAPVWTIFAPVGLTVLLLRVSGVSMMESTIGSRRPGYDTYQQTTNAFIPGKKKTLPSNANSPLS